MATIWGGYGDCFAAVLGPGCEDTGVAMEKRWNHEPRTVNSRVNPFGGLAISPALGLGADRAKAISK